MLATCNMRTSWQEWVGDSSTSWIWAHICSNIANRWDTGIAGLKCQRWLYQAALAVRLVGVLRLLWSAALPLFQNPSLHPGTHTDTAYQGETVAGEWITRGGFAFQALFTWGPQWRIIECSCSWAIHFCSEKAQVADMWHTTDVSRLLLLPDLFRFILEIMCLHAELFPAWKQATI